MSCKHIDVLFCSRGRGRGHATRDLAIAKELRSIEPGVRLAFASYSTGASLLRSSGETVYDLDLPERNPFQETVLRSYRTIQLTRPRLVVAQEETAALTAAGSAETKAVFTTHWFPQGRHGLDTGFAHAHRVLFMEDSGIFHEPAQLKGRIAYVGPVLRPFQLGLLDRSPPRQTSVSTSEDTLIAVLPGSPPESREPILRLVLSAFQRLNVGRKRLVWVAGSDYPHVRSQLRGIEGAVVLKSLDNLDGLILDSTVILTKGTYNITREVMALGKVSISLSHRYNWVDDLFTRLWPNNRALSAPQTSSGSLARVIEETIGNSGNFSPRWDLLRSCGARRVALELLKELN